MSAADFKIPMDPFSEYALILEDDDYPKTDFTQLQFRGKIDPAALAQAFDVAVAKVPIFSAHVIHERNGLFERPYWVPEKMEKNRLIFEDCRHLVTQPFEPMEFSTRFHAMRTRRRIDLAREFPYNAYLIRVEDDQYIFSVLYHHSCMDPAKFYLVFTTLLSEYHRLVKGQTPAWVKSDGMGGLARTGQVIKPVSLAKFGFQQFADIYYYHRKKSVFQPASEEIRDYRTCKGRHSVRAVINDPKLLEGMFARAKRHQATVNDLLLACSRKAITKWNMEHDVGHDKMRFMLISSLTGRRDQSVEGSGAAVSGLNLISGGHSHVPLDTLIEWFRDVRKFQFKHGYDLQLNNLINKFLSAYRVLPFTARKRLATLMVEGTPITFYVSNVGLVWPKIVDGKKTLESEITGAGDFVIDDIHSSASIARDMGIGLTVRTHNHRFYMNFVMDRFRFHKHEAEQLRDRIVGEFINAIS